MFRPDLLAGKRISITGTGKRARRNMGRRCLDGGEWLKAPASSAFLQDMLSKADWQALRPKESG